MTKVDSVSEEIKSLIAELERDEQENIILQNNEELEAIANIQNEFQMKAASLDQDLARMQGSLSEYQWFAYMGHINRKKEVLAWETELRCLRMKKASLQKQITLQVGDLEKARTLLDQVELQLNSTPLFLERAKIRVESSFEYYKMATGKISKTDYETWIFGNSKVPAGDDENFVKDITIQYREAHQSAPEEIHPQRKV